MARTKPTFEQWAATHRPVLPVRLDHTSRPALLVDGADDRLDPAALGWERIPADDVAPEEVAKESDVLGSVLEIGGAVVVGIGLLGLAALMAVGDSAAAATGWSFGGSSKQDFFEPAGWAKATRPRKVEWSSAPALRFVEGGVLSGLPQSIDPARTPDGEILRLRAGLEHLELFAQCRSRGWYRWEATDVIGYRAVPAQAVPRWRVPYSEIVEAEAVSTAKDPAAGLDPRTVLALTFADGSRLNLHVGHDVRLPQIVRYRAGLPGPWSVPATTTADV